jgi:hypothetical protein
MLGSNPSADSVASTDPGGCCAIPLSSVCWHRARIGRGTKAQNPGGAGAKPLHHSLLPLRKPASSHNACIALIWSHRVNSCEVCGIVFVVAFAFFSRQSEQQQGQIERRLISLIFSGRNRIIMIHRELPLTVIASPAEPVA